MPELGDIAGLRELWSRTRGDPRITVAILDGPVDIDRACFRGAQLRRYESYWENRANIDPSDLDIFLDIENGSGSDKEKAEKLRAEIADPQVIGRLILAFHATHIASIIFGQPESPVEGLAYECTGINIPISYNHDGVIDSVNLTRAVETALDVGANVIHVSACRPTGSGRALDLFERAIRRCQESNVLVVAPAGNNDGECWCLPAALPGVIAVGAMKDDGTPFNFSNWGGNYQFEGVLAPGDDVLGAQPGTDRPIRKRGTSTAAPIVSGVAALLLSLQLKCERALDAASVRAAILESAIPCIPNEVEQPERCLRGRLNVPGAVKLLTGETLGGVHPTGDADHERHKNAGPTVTSAVARKISAQAGFVPSGGQHHVVSAVVPSRHQVITASEPSDLVYATGTLGYDFGTEARRSTFEQMMLGTDGGAIHAANPDDVGQLVAFLGANPSETTNIIWLLTQETTPIYALEPVGPFAPEIYAIFRQLLLGGRELIDQSTFIERASVAGRLTGRSVALISGDEVPVLAVESRRGLYGWKVDTLVGVVVDAVSAGREAIDEAALKTALKSFLHRIYYEFRSLGRASRDRALNYAATNAFQAATVFAEAAVDGMQLAGIDVGKSPYCRIDGDCWDIVLKFFDPNNLDRACKAYRFTVDVIDQLPVTLGGVRSWSLGGVTEMGH